MIGDILLGAVGAGGLATILASLRRLLARSRRAPAEPPAAPLVSADPGLLSTQAGRDPKWIHQTLVLKVAGLDYSFRTLSLYDVWMLWPHLYAVKEMILRGRPLAMMDHAQEIVKWINPSLAQSEPEICRQFVEMHANVLLDFYRRQDWNRMQDFGKETAKTEDPEDQQTEEEKHQVFVAVCAAAAQYCSMDVEKFVQQRFEFCADQIMATDKSMTPKKRATSWTSVLSEVAASMAGSNVKIDPENKPGWMKAMEGEPN
jgi:hypothetical protein